MLCVLKKLIQHQFKISHMADVLSLLILSPGRMGGVCPWYEVYHQLGASLTA